MTLRKNRLLDYFYRVIAFCCIVYFELLLIGLLLYFAGNIYFDTRNLFGNYVHVQSKKDIIQTNKKKYNAITLNGMLYQTDMVSVDRNGDIDKIYYLVEMKDAYILFGADKRFIDRYVVNESNYIKAKIIGTSISNNVLINEFESKLRLSKKIIKEFELIEYSIKGMRQYIYIVTILVLIIGTEAVVRGQRKFNRITGWKW